ncbi:tetratricopeptide repeat protein [Ruminococcus bromii]|uniref:Tetratricopeptide repeat protein n=1 Tax=Ruminococcus bromii TaxID=40518 RepID=A0ABT0NK60_9FIRM|nr:tetratricopeptide repeat protein [Ruminococcus bromii]
MPENHPDISASYNNVGHAYYELGDYKKALEYYQRLLSIQNDTLL